MGYASETTSNAGCDLEDVPTAGIGHAPGASACIGDKSDHRGAAGCVYRIYTGPAGKLQFGAAYSYLTRSEWSGSEGLRRQRIISCIPASGTTSRR